MTRSRSRLQRCLTRTVAAAAAATALLVGGAASAWAHVEVDADGATAGASDVILTFHVPNEEAPAVTTSITFTFPADHPLVGATAQPQNGFTPTVTTTPLATAIMTAKGPVSDAVAQVTFAGGTIEREDDPAFLIHVDKLPDGVQQLTFTAQQTYDDGTVVEWTDLAVDGAAEPEHPAPVLELGAAVPAGAATSASPPVTVAATAAPVSGPAASGPVAASSGGGLASTAVVLGGLLALGVGIAAYLRRSSSSRQAWGERSG